MNCAKATKGKVKMVLNMILNAAVEDGLLANNPMKSSRLKITGKASKTTDVYSVEEMQYIVNHIRDVQSPVDRAYIALQSLHPLRLEEVLGLKWEDIDTENMVIHVRRAVTHPDRNQPEIKEAKTEGSVREPLNNSLCSVPTRCISRHLRLVKVISAQNSHYLSAFLLRFPKKGRLPLCQVVESFRPAMASAYKLAQANMAYSRFSFFFRPRYTVFL